MKRITTLLFPLVFAFINVGSYAQGTWSAKTPMPTARQHLCSAVYNGKIYVFGGEGISGNQMLQVNEMYDPPTESWTTMSPMPSGVGFCNAGTINGKIYVVGGWNGSYQTNQNWEFNPVTNSWIVKAAMPTTRSDAAVAVVNNKLYAIGGWQYGSNPRTENEMYDPVTNTWVTRAPMPTARGYLTVSVVNNKIYAIGSGNSGKKIEEYDPATNVWTTMADMPLAKGGGPGSVVINNEIYVFGGSMTSSDTTLIYTPATNTWRTAAVMPTHRYFITASQVNDSAHVFGGTITGGGPPFLATHEMFYPTDPVLPVSVTITASANNVCLGTAVTFTATPVNGGTAPQYQWKVNGTSVGANNPVFTYPPANSDSVTCVLTSNAPGATGNPAISNVIYMAVNLSVPVSVSITASANPVCQGDTVHYTAHMINPGSNASLQWYVNGVLVSGGNIINGLIAYYPFNGNANDASGNGNNGVDVTATPTTDRFGNPNSAYNFAGLSNPQFIRVPNSPSLQLGNQATFSLWVRINSFYGMDGWGSASPMGFHVMFSKDFDRCCLYEGIYGIANGNIVGQAKSNGWYSGIQFSDTIPGSSIGQWFNLTYVFTPTEGRMFSNGQLIATQSGVNSFSNSNSKDLYFGRLNPLWYPLNGKLDDVRFYNRALSDAEVLQLYQGYDSTFSYVPQDGDVVTCVLTATGTCLSNNPDTSNAITMVVHPLPANLGQTTSCLSQGLVAYYPFNGNANDESGNGNVGVISGASPAADRFGALNCSYDFNGLDNYITIEDGSNFNLQNDMSISIWVNPRSTQNPIAGLLDKDHCSYPNGYPTGWVLQQGPFTNNFYFSYGDGSVWNPPMASNIQLVSNAWNHMIIRKINNVVEYYLNGGLVTANTYPNGQIATNNSTPLYIGKSCLPGNARCFNGAIDDIRIYSRTLTPEEIACLYSGNCNNLTADLTSDSICTGNNTSLNIINSQSGIKYQVLLNGANYGNFQVGNGNTLTFPINGLMQTTSFTVLATNTTTGCYTILDSTFTVHVSALNAVVSPAATICSGTPAILTASGGTGYLWSNGMTTPVITVSPLATTVYYVTV
ncbi:MAG: hypothetical protein NT040_11980, partial [Bacteroidetes bacterium]|nr:hypothetical protein [Bacteroidota bacterium]